MLYDNTFQLSTVIETFSFVINIEKMLLHLLQEAELIKTITFTDMIIYLHHLSLYVITIIGVVVTSLPVESLSCCLHSIFLIKCHRKAIQNVDITPTHT